MQNNLAPVIACYWAERVPKLVHGIPEPRGHFVRCEFSDLVVDIALETGYTVDEGNLALLRASQIL